MFLSYNSTKLNNYPHITLHKYHFNNSTLPLSICKQQKLFYILHISKGGWHQVDWGRDSARNGRERKRGIPGFVTRGWCQHPPRVQSQTGFVGIIWLWQHDFFANKLKDNFDFFWFFKSFVFNVHCLSILVHIFCLKNILLTKLVFF